MPIYLDNAATSFPKPENVYAQVDHYNRSIGAAGGRGGYSAATESQAELARCRKLVSDLLGLGSPDHVVNTFNCTDSLNTVFHGLLKPGDHVVATQIEHNSVLRPLTVLRERGVESSIVPVGSDHQIEPARVRDALRENTRLVCVLHASNVTGVLQPVEDIAEVAKQNGSLVLLDAAQTAGQIPIDLQNMPVDFLAAAGHKGLLGPLGTGVLCIRPGSERHLRSFRQGGTGSHSERPEQPESMPDRFESGNLNMPGIFGLAAGLDYLREIGIEQLQQHERQLSEKLTDGLNAINGVETYATEARRVSVVSFNVTGFEPHDVAAILDQSFGIQCRAGLHCAPGAHEAIGTLKAGGTVRFSPGPFTTAEDVDAAIDAIGRIAV